MKKNTPSLRTFALALVFSFAATVSFAPPKAHALPVIPTIDFTNIIQTTTSAFKAVEGSLKETVGDALAWKIANMAIESMTKSLVNWINSGFQGSPAFVTDLNRNLRGVSDAVASRFFDELSQQTVATTPFQDRILDSLRLQYYLRTSPESFYTRYPYTLNTVSNNPQAFIAGDFSQGGWDAWFATVVNPQNNPYQAQELANQELTTIIAAATGNRLEELSWNRGFLSWRGECSQAASGLDALVLELDDRDPCLGYSIETPGSVIMERLNKQLGSDIDRLVSADEINEIVGALLNQLASRVFGGDSGGLRGVSKPTTGGGASFINNPTGTGSGGTTNQQQTTALGTNFSASITAQRRNIENFQSSWTKIRSAAEAAESRCGVTDETASTRAQATTALVRAANALATISGLQQGLSSALAAGGDQTIALRNIINSYNDFVLSPEMLSAEEFSNTQLNAQDTGDAEPGSMYTQMLRIAANPRCTPNR